MMNRFSIVAVETGALRMALALMPLLCVACAKEGRDPEGLAPPHAPRGFSPASEVVRADERIARCNTVHSLTLPTSIVRRYEIRANENTGVISCSLQIESGGETTNIPARVTGTATTLTGSRSAIEFKEILDQGTVSYVGTFSIDAKSAIDFDVPLTDESMGRSYRVGLRQDELPGRS